MTTQQRKGLMSASAILFGLFGIADMQSIFNTLTEFAITHPVRTGFVVVAVALLVVAFWENILAFFGVYRPRKLCNMVKDHLHLNEGYVLKSTTSDRKNFCIIAERDGSTFRLEKHPTKPLLQIVVLRKADPSTATQMAAFTEDDRGELKDDIGIALEQMNALHHVQIKSQNNPFEVELGLQIPADSSFGEAALMNGVLTANRAGVIVGLVWNKWFRKMDNQRLVKAGGQ